jgi:hypothetical protein
MKWATVLTLLLFEPIIIDEASYNQIIQSAHANMRGTEFEMLTNMLGQLEQKAVNNAKQKQTPTPPGNTQPIH